MGLDEFQDAVTCEGGTEARSTIRRFIEGLKKSVEIEGEVPLELWNVGHGAEDPVYSTEWDITEPVEDVVDELIEKAEEDAMSVGRGSVKFKVIVEGMKKAGRAAFTLRIPNDGGSLDSDDIEDIEELATRKGLMTQLMRHQEKVMKVGLGGSDKVMGHLHRLLDAAYVRIKELEAASIQNVKTYEELLSGKHARDLELRKLENDERRKEQIGGVLLQGVPILLNKFLTAKPEAAPQGGSLPAPQQQTVEQESTPIELMLEGFMHSFDQPQLMKIMNSGIFTPTQLMAFVEIAKAVEEKIAMREAKKAAAPPAA